MGNTNTTTTKPTTNKLPIATIALQMARNGEEYLEIRNYVQSIIGRELTIDEKKRLKVGVQIAKISPVDSTASQSLDNAEYFNTSSNASPTSSNRHSLRSQSSTTSQENDNDKVMERRRSISESDLNSSLQGLDLFQQAISIDDEEEEEKNNNNNGKDHDKETKTHSKQTEEEEDWLLLTADPELSPSTLHNPLLMARFGLSDRAVYTRTVSHAPYQSPSYMLEVRWDLHQGVVLDRWMNGERQHLIDLMVLQSMFSWLSHETWLWLVTPEGKYKIDKKGRRSSCNYC